MTLESSATRSSRLVCEKVSKARLAAATALSTSALEPSAISYIGSSVAGLTTGVDFLATGSTQAPSMSNSRRLTIVNLVISGAYEKGNGTFDRHPRTKYQQNEPAISGTPHCGERWI